MSCQQAEVTPSEKSVVCVYDAKGKDLVGQCQQNYTDTHPVHIYHDMHI
jgi:hypothetical protein